MSSREPAERTTRAAIPIAIVVIVIVVALLWRGNTSRPPKRDLDGAKMYYTGPMRQKGTNIWADDNGKAYPAPQPVAGAKAAATKGEGKGN